MIKEYYNRRVYIYILECIVGLSICYTLYKNFPQHQFYWSMISAVLVIAPDGKDSDRLAFDRMKANILGSLIGLLLFLIHQPNLFLICIAVILTILIGTFFKLNNALRSALSALVIVMIHEEEKSSTWHIAIERMGCVMLGCIVGLLITLISNSLDNSKKQKNKDIV
ncbi:MAG: hypothetical protein JWQ63_43 [Mucilaginibacter sp.]|jgi:uncharacterized membrane protein YgaE (UPF0421/DUF939 family)|nr:hypothetical protein [Mucilaginibacter sp.]